MNASIERIFSLAPRVLDRVFKKIRALIIFYGYCCAAREELLRSSRSRAQPSRKSYNLKHCRFYTALLLQTGDDCNGIYCFLF